MVLASLTSFMVSLTANVDTAFFHAASQQVLQFMNSCLLTYMGHAAVRFVLNDIFSGLRADDRQKLLHVSCRHQLLPKGTEQRQPMMSSHLWSQMLAGRRWACCSVCIRGDCL